MPATFNVSRPWGLNAGGNTPNEWGQGPYATRTSLSIYSNVPSTSSNSGFYSRQAATLTSRSSAAIRAEYLDPASSQHMAGWFVINGLAPSTQSGINFVAQFAILSCLRTFHDAGAPTNSSVPQSSWANVQNQVGSNTYRIEPVPLVDDPAPQRDCRRCHPGRPHRLRGMERALARWDGQSLHGKLPLPGFLRQHQHGRPLRTPQCLSPW